MKKTLPNGPAYLISYVCLDCRKSFKRQCRKHTPEMKCPHCASVAHNVGRNFHAPKRTDDAQWQKVELLIRNGFPFQSIYDSGQRVRYPETLAEAREFVKRFEDKAIKK